MLLVDTVNLTIWILLNVTAPLQTPGGNLERKIITGSLPCV